jgi:GH24 family phage-related lysozyme (muramidase)
MPTPAPGQIRQTAEYEGFRPAVYKDTKGIPTVGIGFNLNRPDAPQKLASVGADYNLVRSGKQALSYQQALALHQVDLYNASREASRLLPNYTQQPPIVQQIMTDLVYNLGARKLSGWGTTLKNLAMGNYSGAAQSLSKTAWYNQVGRRSREIVSALNYLGSIQ